MRARILGPLSIESGGRSLTPEGPRRRAVLAYLLIHANRPVPAERLVVDLWGEEAPARAVNSLQQAVRRLRGVLPEERLVTSASGYRLVLAASELDAARFEQSFQEGREAMEAGDVHNAGACLDAALAEWQGDALLDFRYDAFAQPEISRLEDLRLSCLEARASCALATGHTAGLVGELTTLVAEHPEREQLRAHLMVSLYRQGDQQRALEVFQELQLQLRRDLGVDAPPALRRLHQQVLRQDDALLRTRSASPVPQPRRRPITVVCATLAQAAEDDVVDVEARDEALVSLSRRMAATFSRHGGELRALVGRHAVAAFGVGLTHEDDALRGVTAAAELAGLTPLPDGSAVEGLAGLGVASGEAVVGGPASAPFATDLVERAIALADDAGAGEVLLDLGTLRRGGAALTVDPGFAGQRLVSVTPGSRPIPLRLDVPLVGRQDELSRIGDVVRRSVDGGLGATVVLSGEAGVGKSRLVMELAARHPHARFATGRCTAYGDTAAFAPVRQILAELGAAGLGAPDITALVRDDPEASRVGQFLAAATSSRSTERLDPAQIFWAFRRLLSSVAARGSLVVVLDDLHWAEEGLLGLVEHLAASPVAGPCVVIAAGRPDAFGAETFWARLPTPVRVSLDVLTSDQADRLLAGLVDDDVSPAGRRELVEASGGNPLFLEQLAGWVRERPARSLPAGPPPSLHALLAARVHALGPAEREVLDRAAVAGRRFPAEAVEMLLPGPLRPRCAQYLARLAERGLVGTDDAGAGRRDHAFRHGLIHQVAYSAVPRAVRAQLHERLASWMEQRTGHEAADHDQVGFHLEQAVRHRPAGAEGGRPELAGHASWHLEQAAGSAMDLGDAARAAALFERATGLLDGHDEQARPMTGLGMALAEAGRLERAVETLAQARRVAAAANRVLLEAHATGQHLAVLLRTDVAAALEVVPVEAPRLLEVFDRTGDLNGASVSWHLVASMHWTAARAADAEGAWARAGELARRAGWRAQDAYYVAWLASAALWGPRPADEAIPVFHRRLQDIEMYPVPSAITCLHLAGLHAMRGEIALSDELVDRATGIHRELGATLPSAVREPAAYAAELAGDLPRAEELLRGDYELLRAMGETNYRPVVAARLARVLVMTEPGLTDEAEELVAESLGMAEDGDLSTAVLGLSAAGRVLAAQGRTVEAAERARQAVLVSRRTDFLPLVGDALADLGHVLRGTDARDEARRALAEAVDVHRRKGNLAAVRRVLATLPIATR